MNENTNSQYAWVKSLESSLLTLDSIPQFGMAPPFPLEEMTLSLSKVFERGDIQISILQEEWKTPATALQGLGDGLLFTHCLLAPIEGEISWVMSAQDIHQLSCQLISSNTFDMPGEDRDFLHSFQNFLTIEALHAFDNIGYAKKISPQICEEDTPPSEDAYCIDLGITLATKQFLARLFLSATFMQNWRKFFAHKKTETLPLRRLSSFDVDITALAGAVEIKSDEWNKVKAGDVVLLDFCTLDPSSKEGPVSLCVNGHRAMDAHLSAGTLTIGAPPAGGEKAPEETASETKEDSDSEESTTEESKEEPSQETKAPAQKEAKVEEDEDDFDDDFDDDDFDDDDFDDFDDDDDF